MIAERVKEGQNLRAVKEDPPDARDPSYRVRGECVGPGFISEECCAGRGVASL